MNYTHKHVSMLGKLTAVWLERGWDPSDMALFRMEDGDDAGGDAGGDDGGGDQGGGDGNDRGFPADTPIAEMAAEQQAAYWKHQARKHENTVKARGDYDALKAKAAEADRLRQERETESEAAVRKAREEGEAEARKALVPSLVASAFRAEAKGVLTDEQRDALLEDLDLSRYLTDTGEVDTDRVAKKVAAIAPKGDDRGKGRTPGTGGQGRREERKVSGTDTGREMFEARRKRAS